MAIKSNSTLFFLNEKKKSRSLTHVPSVILFSQLLQIQKQDETYSLPLCNFVFPIASNTETRRDALPPPE